MADDEGTRVMHMVSDVQYSADGMTVLYGPGELHEPGSLPDGVPFREVAATHAQRVSAPVHATVTGPERIKAEAAQRAEFEQLQTRQGQDPAPKAADRPKAAESPAAARTAAKA